MLILGLAGQAAVGKDTVADYLVRRYGFVKFAFSDAIYQEVQDAYGLEDQSLLRDRETKEEPTDCLSLRNCQDNYFVDVAGAIAYTYTGMSDSAIMNLPWSPRQVLQWWGTEYRRAQDLNYWVNCAAKFVARTRDTFYPEHAPQFFVEIGTRFENEREWIQQAGGNIWHIHRDSVAVEDNHASAQPLPILPRERQLWNNDSIDRLHMGIDILLATHARFVRVEPMEVGKTENEDAPA